MTGAHFEQMAADYDGARPPYPPALYAHLLSRGVIGSGMAVLEIGAGTGLATTELVAVGCRVTAVEPGAQLAEILQQRASEATVLVDSLERARLEPSSFDTAVAATSLHWVDLEIGLPVLHRVLRPGGHLAVWRHVFGRDGVSTPFRERVFEVVAAREGAEHDVVGREGIGQGVRRDARPSVEELTSTGHFSFIERRVWEWSIHLMTAQIVRLFSTFSDWTVSEVEQVGRAADELGGSVLEHYSTRLELFRRV